MRCFNYKLWVVNIKYKYEKIYMCMKLILSESNITS